MLFTSVAFLLFFFALVFLYYVVPKKMQWGLLLAASLAFYMCWNPLHILVLLGVTVASYAAASIIIRKQNAPKTRKICVAVGTLACFAPLALCKYTGFLTQTVYAALDALGIAYARMDFTIALPVGISFFSFKAVSYIVDAYRGRIAERNFLKYLLYVSFFPQISSGPIERSTSLIPQLSVHRSFDPASARRALHLMLMGYFKKMVVADNLAPIVAKAFDQPELYSPIVLAGMACVYSIQILCDFSGYSDIAVGCAEMFGIHTEKNFDHPYFSTSIASFWRNWHISLSSWFRDYLYIPLGGNRRGTARKYLNLLIVFLVSGLWHGAAWNFVFWGLLHALYQIIGALTAGVRAKITSALHIDRHQKFHHAVQIAITFALVTFAWIFFRAESISAGFAYVRAMFTNLGDMFNISALITQGKQIFSVKTNLISFALAFVLFLPCAALDYARDLSKFMARRHIVAKILFYGLMIACIVMFSSTSATDFIYIRF